MRFSTLSTVAILAGLSAAQDLTALNNLPPCGKTCIGNMLALAPSLGCGNSANTTCLCTTPNFEYGVRDCVDQSCPPADKGTVISFGNSFCAAVLASVTGATGVATVTQTISSGSATVVVSTGTDSTGAPFTTTLGALGAGASSTATVTTAVNATVTTTVGSSNGTAVGGVATVTTTGTNGTLTTFTTTSGVAAVTSTASGGSLTTLATATGSTAPSSTSTSSGGPAGHLALNGLVGGLAGLLVAFV